MARVVLDDSCDLCDPDLGRPRLVLDGGDCCEDAPAPVDDTPVPPPPGSAVTATVKLRRKAGVDDDGVVQLAWSGLVTDVPAVLDDVRQEFDADAGFTTVKGKLTVEYTGPTVVRETAVASTSDGQSWRVLAVEQSDGILAMTVERIDARADDEEQS